MEKQTREIAMAEETFSDNLLRAVVAQLHLLNGMTFAREMFSKSYFALGAAEKATVDQTMINMLAGNYQSRTPETLASQKTAEPVGFLTQSAAKTDKK
jgi:hypothetical protein